MSDRASFTLDDDGLGRLTLTRADARNAIDPAMVERLAEAVNEAAAAQGLRALLMSAEGPSFSVGGDLRYMGPRVDRLAEEFRSMIGRFHEALTALAELPVPVVCAVRGAVAGGALGLLWCSDVTIVANDAKLVSGFLELGLSGDGGSSWWLPRLVGLARARELLLGGRELTGAEAAELGLVARAVPAVELDQEAERVARDLAERPTDAYAEIRRLLARSLDRGLAEGLQAELEAMVRTVATDEARARMGRWG
jgi:enoyl-CoA hydratase/carnithine racemase